VLAAGDAVDPVVTIFGLEEVPVATVNEADKATEPTQVRLAGIVIIIPLSVEAVPTNTLAAVTEAGLVDTVPETG
jgi:hypothetical protein